MQAIESFLETIFENFFHLPTLIILALLSLVAVWLIFDMGVDAGEGFIRLNSNQGNLNLYWINGCCDLEW